MKRFVKLTSVILLVSLTSFIFFCSENTTEPKEEPPIVPPQSTFVMDFSDFTATLAKVNTKSNWLFAAGHVAVWNSVLTLTLVVPVAAFVESFNHNPVLQPDGSWLWSYQFRVAGVLHTAKLYGKPQIDGVNWEMYISKQGIYSDFLWYIGESDFAASAGMWELNLNPNDPTPFLRIDWHRNPEAQTADIKYTNIVPEGDENGSYILQEVDETADFTRSYQIYSVSNSNSVEIEWNHSSKVGRVKNQNHFGDEDWHCWDENLNDVECP